MKEHKPGDLYNAFKKKRAKRKISYLRGRPVAMRSGPTYPKMQSNIAGIKRTARNIATGAKEVGKVGKGVVKIIGGVARGFGRAVSGRSERELINSFPKNNPRAIKKKKGKKGKKAGKKMYKSKK